MKTGKNIPIVGEVVSINGSDYAVRNVRVASCRKGTRVTLSVVLIDKGNKAG